MILDDLADVLTSGLSTGTWTVGTNVFKAAIPSAPDAVIALFLTGGPPPVHGMATGPGSARIERPHVAIWARDPRPDTAHYVAQQIRNRLDALGDTTINGVRYLSVYALQQPFALSVDETGRPVYACNYEIMREPATSS